jgi:hypothetical protein
VDKEFYHSQNKLVDHQTEQLRKIPVILLEKVHHFVPNILGVSIDNELMHSSASSAQRLIEKNNLSAERNLRS